MTVELAPNNKRGLTLASPLLVGSGAAGYADAWGPGLSAELFGAVIMGPISLRSQRGAAPPRIAEIPGGFLLQSGEHNPGYHRLVQEHGREWRRLGVPLLAALASDATEWSRLASHLEEDNLVAGIELRVSRGAACSPADAARAVAGTRASTTLPLLVQVPSALAETLAGACAEAGADALVIGEPPYAAFPAPGGGWIQAPVSGPLALPFTLRALRAVAGLQLEVPLVAVGGIHSSEGLRLCLEAGASAAQVRSLLWTDPAAARRLAGVARELR